MNFRYMCVRMDDINGMRASRADDIADGPDAAGEGRFDW